MFTIAFLTSHSMNKFVLYTILVLISYEIDPTLHYISVKHARIIVDELIEQILSLLFP